MTQWKNIPIAEPLLARIRKIYLELGYSSLAGFIDDCIRHYLPIAELQHERNLDKKVEERMEETVIR